MIGMLMLNTRFFALVNNVIKAFLIPVILGKNKDRK
jgi:hypothetical protein